MVRFPVGLSPATFTPTSDRVPDFEDAHVWYSMFAGRLHVGVYAAVSPAESVALVASP